MDILHTVPFPFPFFLNFMMNVNVTYISIYFKLTGQIMGILQAVPCKCHPLLITRN